MTNTKIFIYQVNEYLPDDERPKIKPKVKPTPAIIDNTSPVIVKQLNRK